MMLVSNSTLLHLDFPAFSAKCGSDDGDILVKGLMSV